MSMSILSAPVLMDFLMKSMLASSTLMKTRAFRATGATCLLVRSSGPRGPALTERQGISGVRVQQRRDGSPSVHEDL